MITFTDLAQRSTGKRTLWGGFLPPIATMLSLAVVAGMIATGAWLWTGLWSGVALQAVQFLPFLQTSFLAVAGTTLLNFWFNRDINTFLLNTREVRKPFVYSQKENPTNLWHMVNHLRQEVNAHFRAELGDAHTDLPMPRLLTFTSDDFKIVTNEGRNKGKAALFFSSGALLYGKNNMGQKELAALIQKELVKIYMRRGVSRTIIGMVSDFANTLQNLSAGNWFFKLLGILTGPLQFVLLIERAVNRSFEYEAAEKVVVMGRGPALIRAIDSKVCSTLENVQTQAELAKEKNEHKRKPYNGPFQFILKPIADWVDRNEYPGDDKTGYRFLSFFEIAVRELGFYIQELWNRDPRSTNVKVHLRPLIQGDQKIKVPGKPGLVRVDYDNAETKHLAGIERAHNKVNQKLFNKVPAHEQYLPIAPNQSGHVKPILARPEQADYAEVTRNLFTPANHAGKAKPVIRAHHVQEREAKLKARARMH